jgi:hypothetical protein
VLQFPHSGHLPSHLGLWYPQNWHLNIVFVCMLDSI